MASACQAPPPAAPVSESRIRYEGARLVLGDQSPPIDDGVLVVDEGRIVGVGPQGDPALPPALTRVRLSGKTVIPALVGLHVHLGYQDGLSYAAENYTRANIADQLRRYAYYGVGTVVSLGTDAGATAFDMRERRRAGAVDGARVRTAGRGLAAPHAGPGSPALRGSALGVTTEEEGRRFVAELAAQQVDAIKIWVDDRNGTVPKLEPALYRPIIDEAHAHGHHVIAHVFYYDDAVELVRASVDGLAHLVRDREMDDEMVAAIVDAGVFVMPNLGVSERRIHREPPPWLADPLLSESVPADVLARAEERFHRATDDDVERGRARYEAMKRSVARLEAAGAHLVLGADSGVQDHFPGYAELRELELMVAAGLTPAQAITAATERAAAALGFDDVGSLAVGKLADFVVLDADPLHDIRNVRVIDAVYLGGRRVDREALRAGWAGR